MFDKLEDLVGRLEDIQAELSDPSVVNDQNRFRKLMKEQNDLTPLVEKYQEYMAAKQTVEDSLVMIEEETDEELKEMAKEELSHYFPEMLKVTNKCKYSPCTHTHEPGCAVKDGVDAGTISPERYLSYLGMLEDEDKYR